MAVSQLEGRLSREINQIRGDLIDLLASVEASIDFPDEDLDFLTSGEVTERIYPGMGHTVNQDEIESVRRMMAALADQ